ncbi:MAG: protease HtpX [Acidobacteria bacterium]|nr:MAG: protease HtpX [Acidobacteriota bacterium]
MQVFKTTLLMTVLTVVLLLIGNWLGGDTGMIIALIFAGVMNFASYFYSDKIALKTYNAQPATRQELPNVYRILESLTGRENLPMPKVYVIPVDSPNAFATGRNPQHASVAVTRGILQLLSDEELEGVLGHELGHVRNHDILISSVAATLAGAIILIARFAGWAALFGGFGSDDNREGGALGALALMIVAPVAAMLIQLAISRSREYAADASGAKWTGNPQALASALEKLDAYSKRLPMQASPSTAHLFIIQPRTREFLAGLFSTHPPIPKRVERLLGHPVEMGESGRGY